MAERAWSTFEVKSVDADLRIIAGIASTPETDRSDDIVESTGAEFRLPLPLLWQHDPRQPIGEVLAAKVTKAGIEIKARIAKIEEPGALQARLDDAWLSLKSGLVKGLSMGFKPIESEDIEGTWGRRFTKWLWLELSAVTIPANASASIQTVKQYDLGRALPGSTADGPSIPAVALSPPRRRERSMKKTISERVTDLRSERKAIADKMTLLMQPVVNDEGDLTPEQQKEYDDLVVDLKDTDASILRFESLEQAPIIPKATPVSASTVQDA